MTVRLLSTVAVLASLALSARADEPTRPNVLFVMSDDLNNLLGCYGDKLARTPNLDRLAQRGVRFDRAYCSYPLCGPSRNSLLTGLYPNSTGIHSNGQIFRQTIPSQVSMPQAFRLADYFVARIGKLYHYNVPNSIGTNGHDDPGSWEVESNPAGVDRLREQPNIFSLQPGQFGGTLSWYASPSPDERHTDWLLAEDADWVLERCAKRRDRPFFLAVGFYRPHTPYVSPAGYFDLFPKDEMPVVLGVEEDQADLPRLALSSAKKEQDEMSDDLRRQARQAYYASISFMDAQVGRLMSSLERHGLADNTIIVFTSDHGYHLGEHGLWQKMSLFEGSTRVPLLIVAPGVSEPGSVCRSVVSHVDLFPTLAELCNVIPPANVQGQSLVPMLKNTSHEGRGWALSQVMRQVPRPSTDSTEPDAPRNVPVFGYSLRTPRWRYTEWDEGRRGRELYDHDQDPAELHNLANDHTYDPTIEELTGILGGAVRSSLPPDGKVPPVRP